MRWWFAIGVVFLLTVGVASGFIIGSTPPLYVTQAQMDSLQDDVEVARWTVFHLRNDYQRLQSQCQRRGH